MRGDSGGVVYGVTHGEIRGVDGVDTRTVLRGDAEDVHLVVERGDVVSNCGTDDDFWTRSLSRDILSPC